MKLVATILLAATTVLAAQAQYAAKITVNSGNSFVVKQLDIRGGRLYAEGGQASTSVSTIKDLEFRFAGIDLRLCESMFRSGDRKALESLLDQYVAPVVQYSDLPGNLGDYLVWRLRVQYWNGNTAAVGRSINALRTAADPAHSDEASLYFVLQLLDKGQLDDAKAVFNSVSDPSGLSVPMSEYIRGRFAVETGDYRQAMQHVSKILAFHNRDAEWMPPATALEARVYKETGQMAKAETVANELMIAYPGSRWSRLGEKIKKETTGTRGGSGL
jgi:hypothetical protein